MAACAPSLSASPAASGAGSTADPTAGSTAGPTAGSATPPVGPSAALEDLSAFRGRVGDTPEAFGRFVRDLAVATTTGPGAVRAATTRLRTWVIAEIDWLAGHDPTGCYGHAVLAYREALERAIDVADAFDLVADPAPDATPPDPADEQRAVMLLDAATKRFEAVEAAAEAALEACR